MKSFLLIILQMLCSIGIIVFTWLMGLNTYMESIFGDRYYQETISIIPLLFAYVLMLIIYLFISKKIYSNINKNLLTKIIQTLIIITTIIMLFVSFLKSENNIKTHNMWFNKGTIVKKLGILFEKPVIIKDVGLTKYGDFYLITDKNHVILPYGRKLKTDNNKIMQFSESPLLPNEVRLENLKKLINKEVKIDVLASKKYPYEFKINGDNKKDVYPLNQDNYYMADITFDGDYHLDMNYRPCNSTSSSLDGFYCGNVYQRQKWYEGERN